MAKIKFNLNFGGEQIRTLDDLRDNFSIEDVLDVYSNGLLVKWLDVHNHKGELEKVNAIHATDARGILTELIRIFDISDNPSEIEESLSVINYLEERKKVHEDMKAHGITDHEKLKKERDDLARQVEELKKLLEAKAPEAEIHEEAPKPAKKSYDDLVREILDNHLDLNHIYDCLDAITTDYPDMLREKHSELFETLHAQKPLTLYALFGHHATRPYFILNNGELSINWKIRDHYKPQQSGYIRLRYVPNPGYYYWNQQQNYTDNLPFWYVASDEGNNIFGELPLAQEQMVLSIREKLRFITLLDRISQDTFIDKTVESYRAEIINIGHPYLKVFSGINFHKYYSSDTDNKWHTIETKGRKFFVFYTGINGNAHLRSRGIVANDNHSISCRICDTVLTFPVFDGINIKTTSDENGYGCNSFCYMEAR